MKPCAIDIYDYDGTLCDNQEYVSQLSVAALEHVIEDQRNLNLSDDEKQSLEHACIVEYAGFFWKIKAARILEEFGIDYNQLDEDSKSSLNAARKNVRNEFFGQDISAEPLSAKQQALADRIKSKVDTYFKDMYGASAEYKPFHDIDSALINPVTIKAIATQRRHSMMKEDLNRFPEIGDHIGERFIGMGYIDPNEGQMKRPKPDPSLILTQYKRLIQEYAENGSDITNLPVRMTGDTVLDVISMRNAQNILNQDRAEGDEIECSVIGVVRSGPYSHEIAQTLIQAAQDPDDPSGHSDIPIYIVENLQQHRELTDKLDLSLIGVDASADFDF